MESEPRTIHNSREALKEKVATLPHKPGVYLYRDRLHRVIYVGKARDLHKRVSQYFHPSRRHGWDVKLNALVECIYDLEHHVVKSEPEALLLEGRLIKEFRPKYNVLFRDDKRFLMVKVTLDDPIPRFAFTRIKKDDGCRYFGPFVDSSALRLAMEIITKKYQLRSCKAHTPGETEHKHCLNEAIKICSAPCVLKITQEEYRERVMKACAALEGENEELILELEAQMQKAAARLDFEKAGHLRDTINGLKKTAQSTRKFDRAHLMVGNLDPQKDIEELGVALGLASAPHTIECFDISNISDNHIVASMVCFTAGRPDKDHYRRYRIRGVEGQNDFASMAEVIRRRYQRVLVQKIRQPDLIVVDGGKGQLSVACKELATLGLSGVPIIGLAKEFEEIHRPEESLPLRLPHDTGALKLLQRIRDEAHRFANGYHQILLKQRISESVLDEIPGISETRKRRLLEHFGSVPLIRAASPEELCEVEGISARVAADILAWFKSRDPETGSEGTEPR
ncbi:MAG: excinuclease ABC subunit UvrC [Verrucomicrobiae bacterium]|nr:excinuclease ABC subunit UvrC [Verrucomicrobiae bacterium]